jgi:hypothetical protein
MHVKLGMYTSAIASIFCVLPCSNHVTSIHITQFSPSIVKGTCLARGDPHYTTFDGTHYNFMGVCEYVLAKDSRDNIFEIRQVNEPCGSGLVACTKSISLVIPGFIVNLERNRVMVNGSTVSLPANYSGKNNYGIVSSELLVKTRVQKVKPKWSYCTSVFQLDNDTVL